MPGKLQSFIKAKVILEGFSFAHALSTLVIALCAYALTLYYPNSQNTWLLLSTILLSQCGLRNEQGWHASWQCLYYLLASTLTALAVFLFTILSPFFWASTALLFTLSFITTYLGWLKPKYFFLAFLLTLLSLLASFYPLPNTEALQRSLLILEGGLLVFTIRLSFFLYQHPRRSYYSWQIFLQKLQTLYHFSSKPEESYFQAAWCDCLAALQAFQQQEALMKKPAKLFSPQAEAYLERIWELTMSLNSLRYRISDKHLLGMGELELNALSQEIKNILKQCQDPRPEKLRTIDFQKLEQAIEAFEGLYQSLLQNVAPEPLVLMLFIQDLHALKEELEKFVLAAATNASLANTQNSQPTNPPFLSQSPYFLQRRAFRCALALTLALVLGHYFSSAHSFWLPMITLLITQSELALPFHQSLRATLWLLCILALAMQGMMFLNGLWQNLLAGLVLTLCAYRYAFSSRRYLSLHLSLLLMVVVLLSLLFPTSSQLATVYDVFGGVSLGLLAILFIFPDKPDLEFSERVIPLVKTLNQYLDALRTVFFEPEAEDAFALQEREAVERIWANRDEYFPVWVFEPGYNPALRPGHSYVIIHLGQVSEILFALTHLARHPFQEELVQTFAPALKDSILKSMELLSHIQQFLEGYKLETSLTDYITDLKDLEEDFRSKIQISLELLDVSRDYLYLAALLRYLKDLRQKLLEVASTLR